MLVIPEMRLTIEIYRVSARETEEQQDRSKHTRFMSTRVRVVHELVTSANAISTAPPDGSTEGSVIENKCVISSITTE